MDKSMPISTLSDCVIGVDAAYYLEGPAKEPLVAALGGFPLALETSIVREIKDWEAVGIRPHFVFDGLDDGINDNPFGPSVVSARLNATAFETYQIPEPEQAIELFRTSGQLIKRLCLAYFEKHPSQFIDAIYGPSELFLYGVDKVITRFKLSYQSFVDPKLGNAKQISQFMPEQSEVQWIEQRACLEELGRIPLSLFTDALLLAGSKALGQFPAFKEKSYTIRDVVNLLSSYGRSVVNLCNQYPEDKEVPRAAYLEYLDQFKRALTGIRHHVVITVEGGIEALDKEIAPADLHYCVGQRLPEELNMYLSRGLVQPRVLSWLASGTILMLAPCEGGDSQVFQNLIRVQLEPMRKQALSLLADSVHRYYQRKEITTKYWFDLSHETKFNIKDLLPSPKNSLSTWNVQEDVLLDRLHAMDGSSDMPIGSLSFAVRSLKDVKFARASITPRSKDRVQMLKSRGEICANAIWRFLQLRGYVDDQHQLTKWGEILGSTLSSMGHGSEWERSALLAIELVRLDLLKPDTMFSNYSGAPFRGSGWYSHSHLKTGKGLKIRADIDRRNCMLVSRVACLGRLVHPPRGYSGPLSRHLLAYHATKATVQAALRDLVEMSVVTMFLEGYAERDRDDWMAIALTLPLFDEDSCALGVATLTYLDELSGRPDPTSKATREETRERTQGWVKHCNFQLSQQHAYQLWDAVCGAVKQAKADGEKAEEVQMWDDVDQWLSQRR
ncbi:MAG: hypothetical protein Q9173_000765 [Seirophora scorigena]